MATKKTIIIGSLYDFTEIGSNELIQTAKFVARETLAMVHETDLVEHRDAHQDSEAAPFFYFDGPKQTFCAEIDQDDNQTIQDFLARMAGYIDYQQSAQFALDDEPRLRPKPGTVMEDLIPDDLVDDQALLKYDSDTDSSDGDALGPMQHLTAYWQPKCGKISILSPMYAREITRLTGSSLFAEEAEKRYRIIQGNFQLALDKLKRLESLLETFDTQSPNSSLRAAGNILIWPPNQQDSRLGYVDMVPGHPSVDRVIVNRQEQTLSRKVLGELRLLESRTRVLEVPHNLQYINIEYTVRCQASTIWSSKRYPSFGDPQNMVPVISSTLRSMDNSRAGLTREAGNDRITTWTNNIVPSANPNIAPEAPVEPVAPPRRRVKVDSDSENDEPIRPVKPASTKSAPKITRAFKHAPAIQLSDNEDLMENEKDPFHESKALSLPLQSDRNNTLIDISGDEYLAAKGPSKRVAQPLPTIAEHNMDFATMTQPASTTSTKQNFGTPSAGSLGPNDPTLEPEVFASNEALPAVQTDSQEDLSKSLSTPKELPPTAPDRDSGFIRPTFDPNAYRSSPQRARGQRGRGGRGRGQGNNRSRGGHRGGRIQGNNRADDQQLSTAPFQASARGHHRGGARANPRIIPPNRSENRTSSRQYSHDSLIDVTPTTTRTTPTIPPGFESIVPLVPETSSRPSPKPTVFESPEAPTTTNTPLDALSRAQVLPGGNSPNNVPSRSHLRSDTRTQSTNSVPSRASHWRWRDEGSDYVTKSIPKVDHAVIRDQSLEKVRAAVAAAEAAAALAGNNNIANEEEPPQLHSTMHQQAGNPGNNSSEGTSKKKVAKDEAAARRQRILEDAYGPTPTATPPLQPQPQSNSPKLEEMSKWKRNQMKKQTPMAEAHPEIVSDSLRDQETSKLVSLLQPVFETGRVFKGKLTFEIQVGQVLITPGQQIRDKPYHSIEDWKEIFETRSGQTFSTFTKILTSNGADIDRALELKRGEAKLWNSTPSFQSISYEFQCQSRSNEDFQIVIDEQGKYELRKGQVNIGAISIHIPAQIWDLSATLAGLVEWSDVSDTVAQSAKDFAKSIYVLPDRHKLILYFRPPNDREIKIQNLIVKRASYHPSCRIDGKEIFLKVTEAKNLQFKVHADDQKLWVAYEPITKEETDYKNQLADTGRIHYEMSIVHSGISDILAMNESLELGERTATTGKSILGHNTIRSLLDSALELVSRIDYIGMWNYGTQQRLYDEENERRAKLMAELGPRARTIAPPSVVLAQGSNAGISRMQAMSGSITGGEILIQPQLVPGVRMNTEAEIMIDEAGQYKYGMGGSRVPVPGLEQEVLNSAASVVPGDSASNAGRGSRFVGAALAERGSAFW